MFALLLLSCQKEDNIAEQWEGSVAVEAILMVGEPMRDIRLKKLYHADYADQSGKRIIDAQVKVSTADTSFQLSINSADSTYQNLQAIVQPSTSYRLEIDYSGKQLSSEAVTPESLSFNENLSDTVYLDYENPQNKLFSISWNEIPNHHYALHLSHMEENPESTTYELEYEDFNLIFSLPVAENNVSVNSAHFEHVGWHRLEVYSIHHEYLEVYNYEDQFNQYILEQGPSNIENGYGFFTGMSRDIFYFNVME